MRCVLLLPGDALASWGGEGGRERERERERKLREDEEGLST